MDQATARCGVKRPRAPVGDIGTRSWRHRDSDQADPEGTPTTVDKALCPVRRGEATKRHTGAHAVNGHLTSGEKQHSASTACPACTTCRSTRRSITTWWRCVVATIGVLVLLVQQSADQPGRALPGKRRWRPAGKSTSTTLGRFRRRWGMADVCVAGCDDCE